MKSVLLRCSVWAYAMDLHQPLREILERAVVSPLQGLLVIVKVALHTPSDVSGTA